MSNSSISFIEQLIESGEYEEAETACIDLLDENENNAEAFSKLGEIYLHMGKEIEAQIFFEKAGKIVRNYLPDKEKLSSIMLSNTSIPNLSNKIKEIPVISNEGLWRDTLTFLFFNRCKVILSKVNSIADLGKSTGITKDPLFFEIEEIISKEEISSIFVKEFLNKRKLSPWALAPGTLEYLDERITSDSRILEFGAGVSTEFLALKLSKIITHDIDTPLILSLEQNEKYVEETNATLKRLKLDNYAKVLFAPLVEINFKGLKFEIYDIREHADFISKLNPNYFLVDGPSGGGLNRLGSLIIASKFASANSSWMLDDALRDVELNVLKMCNRFGIATDYITFQGKGIAEGNFKGNEKVITDFQEFYGGKHLISSTHITEKLTWEDIKIQKNICLYAGDIPDREEYKNLIGLSIEKKDFRHILHDITKPLPLDDNTVDSFQAEDVFEHIPYEKLPAVFDEIFRVLKPGATLRLSIPDYGCDVLIERSVKDENGKVIFDPGGGGTIENPGHLWFPVFNNVKFLISRTKFSEKGKVDFLHYYKPDGTFELKQIDYSKGFVMRNPDNDKRVQNPRRPLSLVVDLTKPLVDISDIEHELFYASENKVELKYSIILTVYQKEKQIRKILEGLISNTISPFEFIIVFDGCTDKSEIFTRDYLSGNMGEARRILFVRTSDVNETKANNAGLRLASGKFSILVQDDMLILERGWEKRLSYPLKMYEDVFAVGARNAHSFSYSDDCTVSYTDTVDAQRNIFKIRDSVNRGPIALKTDILKQLNFFDEEYSPLYFDDMDLCIRAFLKYGKKSGVFGIKWENIESTVGANSEKILSSGEKFAEIIKRNRNKFWNRYHDIDKNLNHDKDITLVFDLSSNNKNINDNLDKSSFLQTNALNTHKYYSQGGEDNVISKIFSEIKEGIYIDVGAHYPVELSNTYYFYDKGWRGICVEPNLDLISNYKVVRPRDVVLNIAAGNFNGNAEIYFGEYTVHSSLKKSKITNKGKKEVRVMRLEDILDSAKFPKEFEFISVDTEGTEIDVLKGLNLEKYRPRIIVAEYNTAGKVDNETQNYLLNKGYNIIFINNWNMIFSNNFEQDIRKIYT